MRELAIHLSKKDNNYVMQFSVVAHVPSKEALFVTLRYTMVLRFARNIIPESKGHESKHLKKANSNSAPLLNLLHLKHELFLFVLQSTRKMIGFKQTSNNSRNTVDMIRTITEILVRLLFQSPCEVFLFIDIHTVHEMTPFTHQDAINKLSNIRKSIGSLENRSEL